MYKYLASRSQALKHFWQKEPFLLPVTCLLATNVFVLKPERWFDRNETLWKNRIISIVYVVDKLNVLNLGNLNVDWMIIWKNLGQIKKPEDGFILWNMVLKMLKMLPSRHTNVWLEREGRAMYMICCVQISTRTLTSPTTAHLNTEQDNVFFLFSDLSSNLFEILFHVEPSVDRTHWR